MPQEQITVGPVFPMIQNTIYAMPAAACVLYADTAATIVSSLTVAMTATTSNTLVEGKITIAAAFIKCTSAGPVNVILKKA